MSSLQCEGAPIIASKAGLSAADFGTLTGVSGQSIYHWESGKPVPRQPQLQRLASLRGLGKKEVMARLDWTLRRCLATEGCTARFSATSPPLATPR